MKSLFTFAFVATLLCSSVIAAEPKPVVDETFDAPLSKKWTKQTGAWKVEEGVIKLSQLKADNHIAAFRLAQPIQDARIQVDFTLKGAKVVHLGFDPAKGELKKKGHLYSVVLTPKQMIVQLSRDKNVEESKNENLATAEIDLQQGKSYSLVLEMKGDHVDVELKQEGASQSIKATVRHPSIHVKKPGLVFRVGGADGQELHLDRVRVWN
ncbi:MAG: hypothetical protein P8M30_09315 [Planctomycetaceae bacterium]|jgi:hypothetical protein|nr:hypothetical protein [bacterium]MDB4679370.1 hypothetical protein [Planctomycetaceae bacterium]MDC0307850.1 hypothetical protein [Planctomycetaceae bacterium]MDG2389500.1 hypothetical protein [Planctomycetaceae bacterium]